jgi:hypothetical protein
MQHNLLSEVRETMALLGVEAHRFGILAAKNGRLVDRLEKGGRLWPETEQKVREFIADVRAKHGVV